MACACASLTIWLESIEVLTATNRGSGLFEMLFGRLSTSDNVSFAAISQGTQLVFPPDGRRAWPGDGNDYSLSPGDKPVPNERVKIASVVPFGGGCDVAITSYVEFYEHDWESLQSLVDQAVEQAVAVGLIQAPAPVGGFLAPLGSSLIKVAKEILNLATSLKSEKMGEASFELPAHRLDDPANLDQLPWMNLRRDRVFDARKDSFRYRTQPANYGGLWEVVFYVERICVWPAGGAVEPPGTGSGTSDSSAPKPGTDVSPKTDPETGG